MSIARVAAGERVAAEKAVRQHKKMCVPCSREKAMRVAASCPAGTKLSEYLELMRTQQELLKSPPEPELVQDSLF